MHRALLLFLLIAAARAELAPAKDRIVVLITLDGFPSWLWNNPLFHVPNLRRLAGEGAIASAMEVSNPSVTWICHTTLVTGVTPRRHGVLFNGLLVRGAPGKPPAIEQWRDKAELVRVPTVYDAAFNAGLKTAQVDWVAILNSGTIHHEMLEIPKPEGEIERELVVRGVVTDTQLRAFMRTTSITSRDEIWTQAATHIIRTRKPNLLLLHLLSGDAVNHMHGPGSYASHTAFAYMDRSIGDVLDALAAAGLRDRATVIVTTDHGFKKVKTIISPNAALRNAGMLAVENGVVARCDAYVVTEGGLAFAYITDPAKRGVLLPRLRDTLGGIEGVEVHEGNDAPKFGMPAPAENQGMGDLILVAKAGYAFIAGAAGEALRPAAVGEFGTHGYPASDPEMDGFLVAWGAGIRRGAKLDRIRNVDVAPTIAELLGVPLPNVEGRVLREFLNP
jgi:predicted AlkP superfamily pyrophosphatase or phosphodiesterase